MSDEPRARVLEVDGKLVLDDPDARAVAGAIARVNCRRTLQVHLERARFFIARLAERGDAPSAICVVIIHVDDVHGRSVADLLMPNHDWQAYRDRGEAPYARGLAGREGMQAVVSFIDREAGEQMATIGGPVVVVVDHGTAAVFDAADLATFTVETTDQEGP